MALTKVIGAGLGTVTDNVVITSDDPTITMTDSSGCLLYKSPSPRDRG